MVTVEKAKYDKAILKKLYGGGPKLISITDEEAQELGLTEYVPNEITGTSEPQGSTGESESQKFINGIWTGTIFDDYYVNRYSDVVSGDGYDTEIYFYQDDDYDWDQNDYFSKGGTGYQIDRNHDANQYYRNNFIWRVIRGSGNIDINYEDSYKAVIRDYDIYNIGSTKHFKGTFEYIGTSTVRSYFNFVYLTDN